MKNIHIKTIPHHEQKYNTCGDYWLDENGDIQIRVSKIGVPKFEELIAIHELAEALLVLARGIPLDVIDKFDKEFENKREAKDNSEPGDNPYAPYKSEHFFATTIERMLSREYNVDWNIYNEAVDNLFWFPPLDKKDQNS